jgi:hypothetical protein
MHSSSLTLSHTRAGTLFDTHHLFLFCGDTPSLSRFMYTTPSLSPTHTGGVRARREDVHPCTHSLAHTRGYAVELFLNEEAPHVII